MKSKEAVRKMYAEMFSKKIKKARENTGFTQREVCEELRLKQSTLASYEIGRTQPDYETLGILAEAVSNRHRATRASKASKESTFRPNTLCSV